MKIGFFFSFGEYNGCRPTFVMFFFFSEISKNFQQSFWFGLLGQVIWVLEGLYFDPSIYYLNANEYWSESPRIEYKDWWNSKYLEISSFISCMSMYYTLTAERPKEDVVYFTYIDSQDGDLYICGSICEEPLIVGQPLHVCDQTKQKSSGHSLGEVWSWGCWILQDKVPLIDATYIGNAPPFLASMFGILHPCNISIIFLFPLPIL